ncbi:MULTISPECIES: hypothetical protein [unclassified Moorena]|uniref:hypothetical protein n=1 Tax=unclassified Moorena TaxID=2683338 RepID=UPI0025E31043|nr:MULTISPECIES: hypothetical protein [unclassified Moorena]
MEVVVPFTPPSRPTEFSALGYLFGRFDPNPSQEPNRSVKGTLVLKQGISFSAYMHQPLWNKLSTNPSFGEKKVYLWRVYFRITKAGKLAQIQIKKFIPLEGKTTLRHSPSDERVDQFRVRGLIHDVKPEAVVVYVERNHLPPRGKAKTYPWQPFLLTLQGSLPQPAEKDDFWEFFCRRVGEELHIEEAHPVNVNLEDSSFYSHYSEEKTDYQPQPSPKTKPNEVIMIQGRKPEITVKFTERPNLPEQGKKVTLLLTGDNGITVQAELNRKTLKKQVEKMDSFADWVAALSGKIARVSPEGVIELEGAGVNVFEKKPKVSQSTEPKESQKPSSNPETIKQEQSQQPPQKQKKVFRLID